MNRFLDILESASRISDGFLVAPVPVGPASDVVAVPVYLPKGTPMWLMFLVRALSAVPTIVAGIEHIHGDAKSGVEKKQLAMEALGLSAIIAPTIDPNHASAMNAATALASQTIDGVVAVMNAAKEAPKPLQPPTA